MRDAIGSSLEEIDRMAKIVENLLTIARLDTGADVMDLQFVDLSQLAQWTIDQTHLLAEEKRISMHSTRTGPVLIFADPGRVKQVLVNLLDNAIKYTADGGEIQVSVSVAQRVAVLEVSDTGIGVPAESLPNVFERFYRSDKARSRESGGTGLGLSIVQAICNAHGGSVAIQSTEGRGTTVHVEFPLSVAPATSTIDTPLPRRPVSGEGEARLENGLDERSISRVPAEN
jgi:signal transduction histidine kinase